MVASTTRVSAIASEAARPSSARVRWRWWAVAPAWLLALAVASAGAMAAQPHVTDPVADNMLLLQTASGGWSKHYGDKKVDYARVFDDAERDALRSPARRDDATLDNKATTSEIAYLAHAHARTGNPAYLAAAGRGVAWLLRAQYANGGWPQFHPDRSGYRHQITLNDDAMVHAIGLLQDIADGGGDLAALTPQYGTRAGEAARRGIDALLALQVRIDGKPTIWAAQYDEITLQPAKARAYELPSLAVAESVGVLRLLMRQTHPDARTIAAIESAAAWLQVHRQPDLALEHVAAPDEATGKDVRVVARPGESLWARFHDLQQQQPLFVDRDSQPVAFERLSNERRVGYAWYGSWPEAVLAKDLPRWRAQRTAAD